jgi:hypothetical protein
LPAGRPAGRFRARSPIPRSVASESAANRSARRSGSSCRCVVTGCRLAPDVGSVTERIVLPCSGRARRPAASVGPAQADALGGAARGRTSSARLHTRDHEPLTASGAPQGLCARSGSRSVAMPQDCDARTRAAAARSPAKVVLRSLWPYAIQFTSSATNPRSGGVHVIIG